MKPLLEAQTITSGYRKKPEETGSKPATLQAEVYHESRTITVPESNLAR